MLEVSVHHASCKGMQWADQTQVFSSPYGLTAGCCIRLQSNQWVAYKRGNTTPCHSFVISTRGVVCVDPRHQMVKTNVPVNATRYGRWRISRSRVATSTHTCISFGKAAVTLQERNQQQIILSTRVVGEWHTWLRIEEVANTISGSRYHPAHTRINMGWPGQEHPHKTGVQSAGLPHIVMQSQQACFTANGHRRLWDTKDDAGSKYNQHSTWVLHSGNHQHKYFIFWLVQECRHRHLLVYEQQL